MQERVEYEQSNTQAIAQAVTEAAKAAIIAVREADISHYTIRLVPALAKPGGPVLKQPMFDWKSPNMYRAL